MKTALRSVLFTLFVLMWLRAQPAPQDNWTLDFTFPSTANLVEAIAVTPEGKIIVTDRGSTDRLLVFDANGAFLQQIGTSGIGNGQFYYALSIAVAADGKIVVYDAGNNRIQIFTPEGTFVRAFGSSGSGDGQFNSNLNNFSARCITISANNEIYATDPGNARVQVFAMDGTFLRKFGEPGNGPGQLNNLDGIGLTPDGRVAVSAGSWITYFTTQGSVIERIASGDPAGHNFGSLVGVGPDGMLYTRGLGIWAPDYGRVAFLPGSGSALNPRTGSVYTFDLAAKRVQVWRRGFRTLGANPAKLVPTPAVRNVAQRTNGYVDIDYIVTDGDSATVTTSLAAFRGGTSLLRDLVPVLAVALVEGTATQLGGGIATGVVHRVTWNPGGASLPSGDLVFEIFARDDRPKLIDLDFIALPTTPALPISRIPITHADMRAAWAWLILNAEPGLARDDDGEITGPGGTFTATVSLETRTTATGRAWLFAKLGVREATTAELASARQATSTGSPNRFTPMRSQQMGDRPKAVNEWSFDSSDQYGSEAWWVVPVQ